MEYIFKIGQKEKQNYGNLVNYILKIIYLMNKKKEYDKYFLKLQDILILLHLKLVNLR